MKIQTHSKIAVVTGANRGIGFEICRQLAQKGMKVILTSRDEKNGKGACGKLRKEKLDVDYLQLNVTDEKSIQKFCADIEKIYGRCYIRVNNAGILPDLKYEKEGHEPSIFGAKIETLREAMETNVYGPVCLCQGIIPLMKKNSYGRIVNMSSGMGQLSEMNGGYPGYRISKTSINALTRILNDELLGHNILVNSMCPGWVKTDMGGANATRPVAKGAETAVWLALLPDNGLRGKFFRDQKEIPW